ncbi:MAG: DOMON-like domain-containing protein [Sphingomonadaceae bacterium]
MLALIAHPLSKAGAVASISVDVARAQAALSVRFELRGSIDALIVPPHAAPARTDGLWQTTCFEVFIQPIGSPDYWELNFSPSTAWAAYRFSSYRSAMTDGLAAPTIACTVAPDAIVLDAACVLDGPCADAEWALGLSAVIEAREGEKAYWALAHPAGAPDFHHRDCFAARIAPSVRL